MSDLVVSTLLFSFSKFKYSVRDCKLTFDPVIFFKVYLNMSPSVIFVKSLIFPQVWLSLNLFIFFERFVLFRFFFQMTLCLEQVSPSVSWKF